ncbi:MAG: radical SAM protein [Deltaproteobacteria bacterium]|nr:radical SAM protein [Deltaproteobacteria bacterium]
MNDTKEPFQIEQGPIRPPSEAQSLLIRVTRNCTWGKCQFCHNYLKTRFSRRTVEEVKREIETIKKVHDEIKGISLNCGYNGTINREVVKFIYKNPHLYGDLYRNTAAWLYSGGKQVFLQDANSLTIKTADLIDIITFLKETFPQLNRITSYARAKTIAKKPLKDLEAIRKAGLSRLHIGLETGFDPLLEYMRKGVTSKEHIEAGSKVKQSGISLSEYVVLGLGGKKWWKEHALETAKVLSMINPDFIRVRTLTIIPDMPLYNKLVSGEFSMLSEEGIVKEERLLVKHLEGITSTFMSDHILNLLEEVKGTLPEEKEKMLNTIDRYLALSDEEKIIFNLGKRMHYFRTLNDFNTPFRIKKAERTLQKIEEENPEAVEEICHNLRGRFI